MIIIQSTFHICQIKSLCFPPLSPHCESSEVGELMTNRLAVKRNTKQRYVRRCFGSWLAGFFGAITEELG